TLGARAAHIFVADSEMRELRLIGYRNTPPDLVNRLRRLPISAPSLSARAAQTQQVQIVESKSQLDPKLELARDVLDITGSEGLLSVPLIALNRLVGVLTYTLVEPPRFSPDDFAMMKTIAEIFAVGLANAMAYDQ